MAAAFRQGSSVAVLVLMVVGVGLNVSNILSLIGTGGLLALLLFILGSLVSGLVLGGRDPLDQSVMLLGGTAFRSVSAALVVAAGNFSGTATVPLVLVGALLLLIVTLPTAKILEHRMTPAPR